MKPRRCILFPLLLLLQVSSFLNPASAEEARFPAESSDAKVAPKAPEGTLLTIQTDDGGTIDCVDIYKQPAFKHPKLKNHTIQMKPGAHSSRSVRRPGDIPEPADALLTQSWHKNGRCPNGSIPIRRRLRSHDGRGIKKQDLKMTGQVMSSDGGLHQYASVSYPATKNKVFYGGHAILDVWSPSVDTVIDSSVTQIWVVAGSGQDLNTIEAGWQVDLERNDGDSQPRFFIYWTPNNYRTGCYNLECPGFVQTDEEFAFDSPLPVSTYQGKQSEIEIDIRKDKESGDWWLYVQGKELGYWPSTIFTSLADGAGRIDWGGEIAFAPSRGQNTSSTQMGSGHFPSEGLGKSSYVRGLFYRVDADDHRVGVQINPARLHNIVSAPSCYGLKLDRIGSQVYLFYGGPGCK